MTDGTALPRFKRAFIATQNANGVAASYQSPTSVTDILGDDGSGAACWFEDDAQGDLQISVVGRPNIWIDETWQIPFRVQILGTTTDDDQETTDQAGCELLGAVLEGFADPSFGLIDDEIQTFSALPIGAEPWNGGYLAQSEVRATGFTLTIELKARLVIG